MLALMEQLGIPASTKIDIKSNNDGTFVVTSDNAKAAAEVGRMLNDGSAKALRNDLIGMENTLKIQQIAQEVSTAQQQVDENPALTEAIYSRLPGIAQHIMAQSFSLTFGNNDLNYTLS